MNARAIRRRLLRAKTTTMWGSRAYLTVYLPPSVLPEPPPPPFVPPGKGWRVGVFGWVRGPKEFTEYVEGVCCYSGPEFRVERGIPEACVSASTSGDLDWYQHLYVRHRRMGDDGRFADVPVPDAWHLAWAAEYRYRDRYLIGRYTGSPVLDAFHDASEWAEATHPGVLPNGRVCLRYAVKWRYPSCVRHFCADVKRAIDVATRHGVRVHIQRCA